MSNEHDQAGDDLGLGDVNELAAAAGGDPAIQNPKSKIQNEDEDQDGAAETNPAPEPAAAPDLGGEPMSKAERRKKAAEEAEKAGADKRAERAAREAAELAGLTGEAKAKHDRIVEIRGRLEAIGDPFAERQRLAEVRAGLLEQRRVRDEELRLKIGEAENALAVEQDKAQWVAQEKHDLERELARLLKPAN